MKNLTFKNFKNLIVISLLLAISSVNAQSPIIKEFRNILADAPNQFTNYQVTKVSENVEKSYILYSSKVAELPFSTTRVIAKTNTEQSVYFIKYDVKNLDSMMLNLFLIISRQYIAEINEMVKTGKYTGKDVKENADDITEVSDLNGNRVMDYISNENAHYVYVYGKPKK